MPLRNVESRNPPANNITATWTKFPPSILPPSFEFPAKIPLPPKMAATWIKKDPTSLENGECPCAAAAGEEIVDAEAARCTALQPWKATAIEAWTLEIVYQ